LRSYIILWDKFMLRIILSFTLLFFYSFSFAHSAPNTVKRVIYVTWDGVRWQDIFDHAKLPIFWKKYAKHAIIYGEANTKKTMEVASIPISLPSYQSQMAGSVQPCDKNECGRLQTPTFPENLVHKMGLNKRDVVSISSWEVTDDAWESVAGTAFANNGTRPMFDPDTNVADDVMIELNKLQKAEYPGDDTRLDKFTWAQAQHYLAKYQPKFLWISFGDADDYAHDGNLVAYHQTLSFYDDSFDQLMTLLKNLHLDKETMIIVTTDHGRGNGDNWIDHGEEFPESKQTWAFVLNGALVPDSNEKDVSHFSTISIRPTVESAFGIG
jgi:hypothetical protein